MLKDVSKRVFLPLVILVVWMFSGGIVAQDQVVLRFGINSQSTRLYAQDWERVIEAFVEQNSQIDDIELYWSNDIQSIEMLAERTDCFATNEIASAFAYEQTPHSLMSFSSLIEHDPTFDPNDFIGVNIVTFEREGETFGLPLAIKPDLLQVDAAQFEAAGATLPHGRWTATEFEEALRQLAQTLPDDAAPFYLPTNPRDGSGFFALMLIAAYGGFPADYTADPPTMNVTDPNTIGAVRDVLNLAKEGLIDYSAQDAQNTVYSMSSNVPIFPVSFGDGFYTQLVIEGRNWVPFPESDSYVPISFGLVFAHISRSSAHSEACYHWIRTLTQYPHLVLGLPTYHSVIDSMERPESEIARIYADLLVAPNTVMFPSSDYLLDLQELIWLNTVFEDYIFEDSNLETELEFVNSQIADFHTCIKAIVPISEDTSEERLRFSLERLNCSLAIESNPAFQVPAD